MAETRKPQERNDVVLLARGRYVCEPNRPDDYYLELLESMAQKEYYVKVRTKIILCCLTRHFFFNFRQEVMGDLRPKVEGEGCMCMGNLHQEQ